MAVHFEETEIRIPPTPDGRLYQLTIMRGEEDGSGGGMVQLLDVVNNLTMLSIRGGWAALMFAGEHRDKLLTWLLETLDAEFQRGLDTGGEVALKSLRKALDL